MRTRRVEWTVLSMGAAAFVAAQSSVSHADDTVLQPTVIKLAEGFGGEMTQDGGAGHEQPDVTVVTKNGKQYVVSVYMSSDVTEGFWQCKCSSVELTESGPKLVANNVQLTFNVGGYRPCNHPRIASDGENMVWVYGSDVMDPDNTATYAGKLDEMCNAEPTKMITDSPDNDVGAPDIVFTGTQAGVSYFVAGAHDNRGSDYAQAIGLILQPDTDTGDLNLIHTYTRDIVNPANVARPVMASFPASVGPMRALFCSAKGNQRPPEIGVECAWLDAMTGDIMHSEIVAKSDMVAKKYYNQPTIAPLEFGRFAVMVLESNGEGRKTNEKGSNQANLYILEPTDEAITFKDQQEHLKLTWPTHAAICSGAYGVDGDIHIGVMGASVTGVGQPKMQLVGYSPESGITIDGRDEWIVNNYGDSGFMANMYGANPGNQGRDFLRCTGSIANPGYKVEGGFMPSVESLFAMPIAGKAPSDVKNGLAMSFIPGKSDQQLDGTIDPGPDTEDPGSVAPPVVAGANEQAGGCSSSGGRASDAGFAVLLGLGVLAAARRRRED